jgi:hypothetical protein
VTGSAHDLETATEETDHEGTRIGIVIVKGIVTRGARSLDDWSLIVQKGYVVLFVEMSQLTFFLQSPAPTLQTEDEKIRQRRERFEAWKKKKAEEDAKKNARTPAAMLSALERQPVVPTVVPTVVQISSKTGQEVSEIPAQQVTASASLPTFSAPRPKADQGSPVPSNASLGILSTFLPTVVHCLLR